MFASSFVAKYRKVEKKTEKEVKYEDFSKYEEFPKKARLVEYIREDKVIKLVVQRLKNKVQEGKRERNEEKKLKQRHIGRLVVPDTPSPFWPYLLHTNSV